jgi:transposase
MARRTYPPEFRAQIVALAESGRSIADLAREFEPSRWTIAHWIKQAKIDAEGLTPSGPMTTDERAELRCLRRENQTLKTEREILAKAAAWFARETRHVPDRSSDSWGDVISP